MAAGVASGLWTATLSSIVVAACGRAEEGQAAGPVSVPSKWLLGDDAAYDRLPPPAQVLLGHAVHTGATIFWAVLFEGWRRSREAPHALPTVAAGATVTGALACFGDYVVAPRRFSPGFERRLSTGALALVYASIAAGLTAWRVRASRSSRASGPP